MFAQFADLSMAFTTCAAIMAIALAYIQKADDIAETIVDWIDTRLDARRKRFALRMSVITTTRAFARMDAQYTRNHGDASDY